MEILQILASGIGLLVFAFLGVAAIIVVAAHAAYDLSEGGRRSGRSFNEWMKWMWRDW